MKKFEQSEVFFTSDLHLGHKRILELTSRPYQTVEQMNEGLLHKWNEVVPKDGHTFILGDLSFMNNRKTLEWLEQANGSKYLIRGNHDHLATYVKDHFEWVRSLTNIRVIDKDINTGIQNIVMCHFPILSWENMHVGWWMAHGHSHGTLDPNPNAKRIDVGIDCWGQPIDYQTMKNYLKDFGFEPVDQHGKI